MTTQIKIHRHVLLHPGQKWVSPRTGQTYQNTTAEPLTLNLDWLGLVIPPFFAKGGRLIYGDH